MADKLDYKDAYLTMMRASEQAILGQDIPSDLEKD